MVVWYFPIIPHLKRLFANTKTAKLKRWHAEDWLVDGKLRHLAYGFIVESYQFQIQESIFQGDKKDKILFEYWWDVSF